YIFWADDVETFILPRQSRLCEPPRKAAVPERIAAVPTRERRVMFKRLLVAFLLTTASVGTPLAQESPKMEGATNTVIQPEPPGLMLAMIQNGPTQMVSGNIFEGLLRYSPKLEPLPGLAESWTVSPDAKVYTFKLKPGVTWHDGKPFTSADVLFSI